MKKFLYHKNCLDGFCAAYIFWLKFGDEWQYIPVQYGEEPPDVKDCSVIIADFSYKRPVLERMRAEAASLLVLDHHKSAEEELKGLSYCIFDMNKCGAKLVQEHFELGPNTLLPFIQDRDLWQWKLHGTKNIINALGLYPFDFEIWKNLRFETLLEQGHIVDKLYQQEISKAYKSAWEITIVGYIVPTVNCTMSGIISDLANQLSEGHSFGSSFFVAEDKVIFSLRSRGNFDVSDIARLFGGGGHKNAAGFSIDFERFKKLMETRTLCA